MGRRPRGRYAPSPTGLVHLGNARTALAAWLSVRHAGGTIVWRVEDLDGPRVVKGMAEAALEDLGWLGLDWDEGHDGKGPYAPYFQSLRYSHYERALDCLHGKDLLFPCSRSRKDLQGLASAPHDGQGVSPYPASLRPVSLPVDWFESLRSESRPGYAIRFKVHERQVLFEDMVFGSVTERVDRQVGDFVLKRRDRIYAYQLAVVVDDWLMGIDEVVRGSDLLSSTGRQIQLFEALGAPVPRFGHVPVVKNERGEKLSKRDGGLTLQAIRSEGIRPEQVVGYLAWSMGLIPEARACMPTELIDGFNWTRIRRDDWVLPSDVHSELRRIP